MRKNNIKIPKRAEVYFEEVRNRKKRENGRISVKVLALVVKRISDVNGEVNVEDGGYDLKVFEEMLKGAGELSLDPD